MLQAEALRILARLKAGFPAVALTEPQTEVLLNELVLLHDARMLDIAVTQIIQRDERFPSIARIRSTYRTNNELASLSRDALGRQVETPRNEIPEWVHVWEWERRRTLTDRQAANTWTKGAVEDRPPVQMRDFPQQEHPGYKLGEDALTLEEYEQIRQTWIEAGRPEFGAGEILQGAVA